MCPAAVCALLIAMAQEGSVTLSTEAQMPLIGLGTWQAPKGEVGAAVKAALEMGYKHIDCAACYGNEEEIGQVFSEVFAAGTVKREDVFVTSKLWNSEHAPADVLPALQKTLADLQLEYLDLYLIHWPQNFAKEGTPGNCSFPRNGAPRDLRERERERDRQRDRPTDRETERQR